MRKYLNVKSIMQPLVQIHNIKSVSFHILATQIQLVEVYIKQLLQSKPL
jgi:hypothetical protein